MLNEFQSRVALCVSNDTMSRVDGALSSIESSTYKQKEEKPVEVDNRHR